MKTKYIILSGVTAGIGLVIYLIIRGQNSKKVQAVKSYPDIKDQDGGNSQNSGAVYLPNWNQPFNQEFADEVKRYLAPKKVVELDPALGKKLSQTILNAKGFFLDDEDDVEALFAGPERFKAPIASKVHLSNLSKAFYKETGGKDLWQYLASFISKRKINQWVSQLSNYQIQP